MSRWEDVSGHFSSRQWKGGGIDRWVSPRTGSSDRIVPDPLCGIHLTVTFGVGMLTLARFVESVPWWWGKDSLVT